MSLESVHSGSLEPAIQEIAAAISAYDGPSGVYQLKGFASLVMKQALKDPVFRADLFRLVDVFPSLEGPEQITAHVLEYLDPRAPKWMAASQSLASKLGIGRSVLTSLTRNNIIEMANQFILGTELDEIARKVGQMAQQGYLTTVDLLGEKIITYPESDRYIKRLTDIHERLATSAPFLAINTKLTGPKISISVKPSALTPHYGPLQRRVAIDEVIERITPLLKSAQDAGSLIFLDMEHYDTYELTLEIFNRLVNDPNFADLQLGLVLQAYLRRHVTELKSLLARLEGYESDNPRLWIRLVKGAYWDTEFAQASSESHTPPVFTDKAESDISYEESVKLLLDNHRKVHPAFGSHNLRSLSFAIAYARSLGLTPDDYEIQMLFGMAEPMSSALLAQGQSVRIYTPVGELLPGMSYLVRRLLENTSNSSFVRARFGGKQSIARLVAPPKLTRESKPPTGYPAGYKHEPTTEFHHQHEMRLQQEAIENVATTLNTSNKIRLSIGRPLAESGVWSTSLNPANPTQILAQIEEANEEQVEAAVSAALAAQPEWSSASLPERATILRKAAAYLRSHRSEINAIEIMEAGKPWLEADNDIGEAIDFLEYYAIWAERLDTERLDSPAGETNQLRYRSRGVTLVIPPWNFPLAIPMGMTAAALVMGNSVILKPAEQTPITASYIVRAFEHAGLPAGALCLVPGRGETVGAKLVRHPQISTIAFTGSRAVGLDIIGAASHVAPGQTSLKRVVAEMGGKNAIVVDMDADLDQAVPGVIYSAFGFAGQKCSACSRVIVHRQIFDAFVDRLALATSTLIVGDPRDPAIQVGPVVDDAAFAKITRMIEEGKKGSELLEQGTLPDSDGYYIPPTVFVNPDRQSPLYREEIFGPVLTVERADDLDDAIWRANDTIYALTQGVFSRSAQAIARVANAARAGNFYVNRGITGAVPGRHPFGGFGNSGVGFKAGGPSYLIQFADQQVISENLLRQGFSPDISE
ncbi:proline dehydrogenase family protein [Ferrimicrobium acidiphilum]|uniref:proline dehydrogenase family protein n=1 Tax=Ferrimicrobium acidiphilum TaxID=121039 RepID=UPI0023F0E9C2|nr:proline dehydrogenase family protein [Ferrimicrobium acidiphilum]